MACIASLSGLPNPFNLLPGQSATYTVTVSIPNIPECNCGNAINTISASASTGFIVTLSNLPALPLAGYCGGTFTIDVTITALPTVSPGQRGVITIEFDHGAVPLQYGYIAVNVPAIVPTRVINLGDICYGERVEISICNPSSEAETFSISNCSCPDFILDCAEDAPEPACVSEIDLDSCECGNFIVQYLPEDTTTEGDFSCQMTITTATGYAENIIIQYSVGLCDWVESAWELTDGNDILPEDEVSFDANCDLYQIGAIGEKKYLSRVLTLSTPVQLNQKFYFGSWLFAPLNSWGFDFPGKPAQGWHCTVCDVAIDGTYQMEWYGSQHSYENGSATMVVSNSGATIEIQYEFYLMADINAEPNGVFVENHDYLLRSALTNPEDLQNNTDNSVYKTERYMMFALVSELPSGTWQRDLFSIKANLVWYGENTISPAVILSDLDFAFTIPSSTQATEYVSSIRQTDLRIEFDYQCSDPAGTVPTDAWLVAFRTDTRNNLLDPLENYVIANADLTNSVADGIITEVVTPPTYISGNRFYTEVTIDTCPAGSTPDAVTLASYRFILLTHTNNATDKAVRSDISREVLSINYDDLDLTFTGTATTMNMADQKYSTNALIVPVNSQVEVEINVQESILNTEIASKTGNEITNILDSLVGVYLSIFYLVDNIRVELFNPFMLRRMGVWVNESEKRGLPALVRRNSLNFVFPFTMPDNVLRNTTSGNYRNNTTRNQLNALQEVYDCVSSVILTMPDVTGFNQPEYMAYVPDTNELWVANSGADEIKIVDVNTLLITATIALTAGDAPTGVVYVPGIGVYVTCNSASVVRLIDIYTRTVTATLESPPNPSQIIYEQSINRLFVICGNGDYREYNALTGVVVTSISTGLTTPECITYEPSINTIFVAGFGSNDFCLVPRSTNIPSAPIATVSQPKSIVSNGSNVWIAGITDIEVVDFTGASLTVINQPGLLGNGMTYNAGIMYVVDTGDSVVLTYDAVTFSQINTLPLDAGAKRITFGGNHLWVSQQTPNEVRPFLLEPCPSIPNYSTAFRTIYSEWRFQFQMLGNEENYYHLSAFPRVRPSDTSVGVPVDDIKYEEFDGNTDTWVEIDNPCLTTGQMRIEVDFTNNQTFLGIAIEQQPTRNNRLTEKSLPSTTILPVESDYISNIVTTADNIQFEFDFPGWLANGSEKSPGEAEQDYEFNIHILAK